jgi:hypothetical protein
VSDLERGRRDPTVVTLYRHTWCQPVEVVMTDDETLREAAKPSKRKTGKT